mmetsp:Transcript_11952/g.28047  ORF Transcript_11952/g.28047 Transcript_11952/m.28047 type:complete len:104 (+) Transcript_11952:69-380(+)
MVYEVQYLLTALEHFQGMIGKPGPCFFDCQVVAHGGYPEQRASDIFQIGEAGRDVEPKDVSAALRAASREKVLEDTYHAGRSYFHEGYRLSSDGKTVYMIWGS